MFIIETLGKRISASQHFILSNDVSRGGLKIYKLNHKGDAKTSEFFSIAMFDSLIIPALPVITHTFKAFLNNTGSRFFMD